jgi:hypothetical protein
MSYNQSNGSTIHIPSRFKDSNQLRTARANRALRRDGPATRLFNELIDPHFYSLTYKHLGLDKAFSHRELIYDHSALNYWLSAIKEQIEAPFMYKFEVGHEGKLHPHLIGEEDAGLLWIPRGGQIIKPVIEGTEKTLLKYTYKPSVFPDDEALMEYERACERLSRQGKGLPQVSGFIWYKW